MYITLSDSFCSTRRNFLYETRNKASYPTAAMIIDSYSTEPIKIQVPKQQRNFLINLIELSSFRSTVSTHQRIWHQSTSHFKLCYLQVHIDTIVQKESNNKTQPFPSLSKKFVSNIDTRSHKNLMEICITQFSKQSMFTFAKKDQSTQYYYH